MARPKKTEEIKLRNLITIRITDEELTELNQQAKDTKLRRSEVARRRFIGNELNIKVSSATDTEFVKEIIRIGQNINQLQKAINSQLYKNQDLALAEINNQVSAALSELYKIRKQVKW